MSFCVSHRSALDKNLRHLYSGLPSPVILRTSSTSGVLDGSLDIMDRVWEKHKRPPERFETKFQEYLPQYSARLPRAPAFRSVSPEEAREISHRLSRPTYMSAIRRQSAVRRGAAERAESRRSRATSGRVDSEYSEDVRNWQTLEAPREDGDPKRKISYQDCSDEEGGAYYYDDEGSSVVESNAESRENCKTENNCERSSSHVIDFSATPSSKKYYEKDETHRNDKLKRNNFDTKLREATEDKKISEQFGNRKIVSEHTATGRRIRSGSYSSEDETRNRQDDYQDRSTPEMIHDSNHDKEHDSKNYRRSISSSSTSVVTDSAQGGDSAPLPQTKSGVPPRKKISLLEQIMQARTPQRTRRPQRSKTYTDNGQSSNNYSRNAGKHNSSSHTEGYPKHLYKREPLNTRLKQSPYCEPMPQLYIVYTPVSHKREDIYARDRANNGKSRTSYPEEWSLPRRRSQTAPGRAKTASPTGRNRRTIELQRSQERSGQRFDTKQLQTKQEYKNGSRGAAEPPSSSPKYGKNREPVRSKSVPPPEAMDGPKTGLSKSDTSRWRQSSFANSTKNDDDFNKSCAKRRQKHQDNSYFQSQSSSYFKKVPEQQKGKSATKQKNRSEERVGSSELSSDDTNGKSEDIDQVSRRRQSPRPTFTFPIRTEVHSEKFSTSTGSPDRTSHNLKTSDDIGDSEDIHRVYYHGADGALYYITPDDNSRRFASAEEMAKANRRLQKPTKANIIRNRMRWAPNNDKDLADPVRVIREVTGGHEGGYWQRRRGDDARGRVDYKSDDDNKERNRSSSGSSDEDNDENHLKIEQEKHEALAMKTKQKKKELKNKKDNWMKKGVIQSRRSLITTQPNSKHGSPSRNPASKKSVSNNNKLFAQQRTKDEKKINNQRDSHASFPQPRRKTLSPTQSPRSRSPSNDSLSSKSTVKSRSRSKSRESSPSRSRSRSRSSSSTSHSKPRSISPPAKEPNKDAKLVDMSSPKGSLSSNGANQNIALGENDSSTAEKKDR